MLSDPVICFPVFYDFSRKVILLLVFQILNYVTWMLRNLCLKLILASFVGSRMRKHDFDVKTHLFQLLGIFSMMKT